MLGKVLKVVNKLVRPLCIIWVLIFFGTLLMPPLSAALYAVYPFSNYDIAIIDALVGLYWLINGTITIRNSYKKVGYLDDLTPPPILRVKKQTSNKPKKSSSFEISRGSAVPIGAGLLILGFLIFYFRADIFKSTRISKSFPSLYSFKGYAYPGGCVGASDWSKGQVEAYWSYVDPQAKLKSESSLFAIKTMTPEDFKNALIQAKPGEWIKNAIVNEPDLSGRKFNMANLQNVKIEGGSFIKSEIDFNCENCEFENVDFSETNLNYSKFKRSRFKHCKFAGIKLTGSFSDSEIIDSDINISGQLQLSNSTLMNAKISFSGLQPVLNAEESTLANVTVEATEKKAWIKISSSYSKINNFVVKGQLISDLNFDHVRGEKLDFANSEVNTIVLIRSEIKSSSFAGVKISGQQTWTRTNFTDIDFSGIEFKTSAIPEIPGAPKDERANKMTELNFERLKSNAKSLLPADSLWWTDDLLPGFDATKTKYDKSQNFKNGRYVYADGRLLGGQLVGTNPHVGAIAVMGEYPVLFYKTGKLYFFVSRLDQQVKSSVVKKRQAVFLTEEGSVLRLGQVIYPDEGAE